MKLLSLFILVLLVGTRPAAAASSTIFKKQLATVSGTIADSGLHVSTINRRSVTYPQNCEMTYSTHSFCGDGDVANYYNNAINSDEEYGHGAASYALVLGYWIEPATGALATHVPTYNNYYAVGYDTLGLDDSHVGLEVINSNHTVSSTEILKSETNRIITLAAMLDDGDQYRMYVAPMLCNSGWITPDSAHPVPASEQRRDAGMLYDGLDQPFGGQACDDTTLLTNNTPTGIFTGTIPPGCPAVPAVAAGCSSTPSFSASGTCTWVTSCPMTTPPASATPVPTGGTCNGSTMVANGVSGSAYPISVSDCPSGSTYSYASAYTPPLCLCGNYVAPTPTPTPTPVPTPTPAPTPTPVPGTCTTAGVTPPLNGLSVPASAADCPPGTTFNPGGGGGSIYIPPMCLCAAPVATPTPTPAPTPTPLPAATGCPQAILNYTAEHKDVADTCATTDHGDFGAVTCLVTAAGDIQVTESCAPYGRFVEINGTGLTYIEGRSNSGHQ